MKPKNIREARELIKKYRATTLSLVKSTWAQLIDERGAYFVYPSVVASELTGFGAKYTCALCISVDCDCEKCIYGMAHGCMVRGNRETYTAIENAKTPEELLNAFRARADHIEKLLERLEVDNETAE